jgi:hypothetical protein
MPSTVPGTCVLSRCQLRSLGIPRMDGDGLYYQATTYYKQGMGSSHLRVPSAINYWVTFRNPDLKCELGNRLSQVSQHEGLDAQRLFLFPSPWVLPTAEVGMLTTHTVSFPCSYGMNPHSRNFNGIY